MLSGYVQHHPDSVIAINLKACNYYKLYNGKAAEVSWLAVNCLFDHNDHNDHYDDNHYHCNTSSNHGHGDTHCHDYDNDHDLNNVAIPQGTGPGINSWHGSCDKLLIKSSQILYTIPYYQSDSLVKSDWSHW